VEDEPELVTPLHRLLQQQGYQVDVAYDGDSAWKQLMLNEDPAAGVRHPFDLLVLDWMLPGYSGYQICQTLRARGDQTPILFLTAKDTVDDRVLGLDAGADDYLVKPFQLRELLARIRALLRRPPLLGEEAKGEQELSPSLQVERLLLDPLNQLLYLQDQPINLSEKETQLLQLFMSHPGQLLTHEQIIAHLWPHDKPSSNVLAAQIRLLRRKIEAHSSADQSLPLIRTVYGKGYRFCPEAATCPGGE
jgi:OmpR-family two-component system manganese-sensing response regulator